MFKRKTALVLGAGASWHYGYPTGEDLVKKVIQKATYAILYLEYSATKAHPFLPNFLGVAESDAACGEAIGTKWRAALARCLALKGGLEQVNPLVIDYYLGC